MSPRSYNLGKRKASVEATRTRIIDAAIDAYAEFNVSGTSMQEVARRANVAPGTVFYHFATAEELAETAVTYCLSVWTCQAPRRSARFPTLASD